MKGGNKLFLFAGVGLALVAVLFGITMSSGDKKADAKKQEASPSKITVVRFLLDVEAHQIIRPEMVEEVELDSVDVSPDAATTRSAVLNQAYAISAAKGDVVLASLLEAPGITSSIDPGMRAISLLVDGQGSMSGLIVAGDYVDVVFKARVDVRRVLDLEGVELAEDGPYSLTTFLPETDAVYQGKKDSEFTATDGGDMLEPIAKMLVQDIQVIRVVNAGDSFDGQGQQVQTGEESAPSAESTAQLIVQVTPQQAEAVAFMQDQNHTYNIAVRGEGDHAIVQTTGVTFQILMTDGTWSLPWPVPVVADDAMDNRATPVGAAVPSDASGDDEPST